MRKNAKACGPVTVPTHAHTHSEVIILVFTPLRRRTLRKHNLNVLPPLARDKSMDQRIFSRANFFLTRFSLTRSRWYLLLYFLSFLFFFFFFFLFCFHRRDGNRAVNCEISFRNLLRCKYYRRIGSLLFLHRCNNSDAVYLPPLPLPSIANFKYFQASILAFSIFAAHVRRFIALLSPSFFSAATENDSKLFVLFFFSFFKS